MNNFENFNVQYSHPGENISSAVQSNAKNPIVIPKIDTVENENDLVYLVELPGINPDSLNVETDDDGLYINANAQEEGNYIYQERIKGEYQRQIIIPVNLDKEHISADYHNGILKIAIPKKPQTGDQ